jgi:NADH-quinone oxidoreductase subunit M
LAVISAAVVVLTAAYILWTLQRVYLGAEYRGPHEEALTPSTPRENAIAGVLFVFAILFGVFPHSLPFQMGPSLLAYMEPTIERQTDELAQWTRFVKQPELAAAESEVATGDVEVAVRYGRQEEEEPRLEGGEAAAVETRQLESRQVAAPLDELPPTDSEENPLASR